ncbi:MULTISPECIES: non-ribosomal peptide synthetase [Bacillus]|uniref:non-ribosomal peptide synthetase n=1 Tax=Bacillus TaxID=1386 RepID=UPI000778437C|nr:non-ribosomal peptide synthetase [Bacillus toyonensis]KXY48259.1 hypothetical protein AT265_17035 [Bacillus cereus]
MNRTNRISDESNYNLFLNQAWNGLVNSRTPQKCVHELFKEQVLKAPKSIALTCNGKSLTYHELDIITDSFAQDLIDKGSGPETVIAVLTHRSIETIVSILSILKAGGCYLAIEPDIPTIRLDYIIKDANPSIIITTGNHLNKLDGIREDISTINIDVDLERIRSKKLISTERSITPSNLAYISYTSGTTGKPKGVCITHQSITRLVKGEESLLLGSDTVFLQLAPIAFDASTLEIWGTLTNGGKLVIYSHQEVTSEEIQTIIERDSINTLWLTSGLFHLMIDTNISIFKDIKHVLAGGDVISARHVNQLLDTNSDIIFTNGYGPTENTTFTTTWSVNNKKSIQGNIPIGKPINGTTVYILNTNLSPVTIGEIGDLYTGGEGLARCYLGRSRETAGKFIPNPFSENYGERMYYTGDQARWNNDGTIDFIGRKDQQVKINGYRVETNEIEMTLKEHDEVMDAVVVVQNIENDKRLIAYVIPKTKNCDYISLTRSLQVYLKKKLPFYMVPWVISIIQNLPLTMNGKVDRNALPTTLRKPRNLENEYIPPTNSIELYLTNLWGEMLKVEPVGVKDDFFELGGHSLIVAQLISQIREDKKVPIHSRNIYLNPTIEGLAKTIEFENFVK